MRTLSASETFFAKFIFPTIWIVGFGLGTIAVTRSPVRSPEPTLFGAPIGWCFPIFWLAGSIFLTWTCFPLKRVRLDGDALLISNYVQEIRVPLADVTGVTENRFVNPRTISVTFRTPTAFGQRVMFIPRGSGVRFWKESLVIEELQALVLQAGGSPNVPTAG